VTFSFKWWWRGIGIFETRRHWGRGNCAFRKLSISDINSSYVYLVFDWSNQTEFTTKGSK